MNYIDFRAAIERLFLCDIIRTEKLYKIAAFFNNQDRKIKNLLHTVTAAAVAVMFVAKHSKFGKV
jgi:hypothetical protein